MGARLTTVAAKIEAPKAPCGCGEQVSALGEGTGEPQIFLKFWISKCRLLVHSERYFLQLIYLLYMQKNTASAACHRQKKTAKQAQRIFDKKKMSFVMRT